MPGIELFTRLLESSALTSRSRFARVTVAVLTAVGAVSILGCLGQRSYYAGRPVPPSNMLQRVLVAVQNPSPTTQGSLQIIDARYDLRASLDGKVQNYFISGYSAGLPSVILNYPEETSGYVYNSNSGSISEVNYSKESQTGSISSLPGFSSSVFVTKDGLYVFAANQASQLVTVIDNVLGKQVPLNLPNVYKVSVNPSGTVVLAFVQNSNYAYRIIRLQQPNGTVMSPPVFHPTNGPWPAGVSPVDCQPVNLPLYCVVPVLDQNDNPIAFSRPFNTIFSSDGTTAWLMNCGPECGNYSVDPAIGQASASVSFLNTGPLNIYNFPGSTYPTPPPTPPLPTEQQRIATPGGATMGLYGNGTLYVSGQQQQSDGLWEGFLTVLNLSNSQITATYPISDGLHTKMLFGDDSTLWIGSQQCQSGWHTQNPLSDGKIHNSCLTYFDLTQTITPQPVIEIDNNGQGPSYGDLTGMCAIIQWHKMYVAMGGQVHIYATTDTGITTNQNKSATGYQLGTELSNYNATVEGTAYDVAYMDAPSDAAD